jgi:hypothetical protein
MARTIMGGVYHGRGSRVLPAVGSTYAVRAARMSVGGGGTRMHARSTLKAAFRTFLAFGVAAGFAALAAGGCNMVSGLDSLTQAASVDDGGGAIDASNVQEVAGEGGVVGGPVTSNCTPDPTFCNTHCGAAKDNCGQPRTCGACGANSTCDPTSNTCQCAVAADFCSGRCGEATDNCTKQEDCGGCEAGTCTGGACGCLPDSVATTCGTQKCGQATNNCHQTVFCGSGGTANCPTAGDVCESNNTCCTPNNAAACANKCNENVVNNCGQTVGCPSSCPSGQVCVGTACCVPDPITTTCAGKACGNATNNCGQVVPCADTCAAPNVCGGGGAGPNGCGCTSTGNPCGKMCGGNTVYDNCNNAYVCNESCGLDGECTCRGGSCNTTFHTCTCTPGPCL